MELKAKYDQTILKEVRNGDEEFIGKEMTTHHYVFGKTGAPISGGLYIKVGIPVPEEIIIKLPPPVKGE